MLQAFLRVAATGSFSLAADQLLLTQPAVSKRIAALESDLDVRLFERLGRRVLLTEAGRALLPKAQHIVREMQESRRLIADLQTEIGGILQVATSHHIGLHRLPGILKTYSTRYPQATLDLQFTDSEAGCQAVIEGKAELAVVTLPQIVPAQLAVTPVWDDPLEAMVCASHPVLTAPDIVSAVLALPLIVPEKTTETRQMIERHFVDAGYLLHIGIETNYLETIRMLVAVGLGWSVLPVSMLNAELTPLALPGFRFHRQLGVVAHARRTLSRAAEAFCGLLHQQLQTAQ